MAGRHYTVKELSSKRGSNNILGTDDDDIFTIQKNMTTGGKCGHGACNNTISLLDGFDSVWIGGKMEAKGGSNTIIGASHDKNITVVKGLDAKAGQNTILLDNQIPHYMDFHRYLTLGDTRATHGGRNNITLTSASGSEDRIDFTHSVQASHDGRNNITVGDGLQQITIAKVLDAKAGGHNNIALGVGTQTVAMGSMNAGKGGTNIITSQDGSTTGIGINGSMTSSGKNSIELGQGANVMTIGKDMVSKHGGENHIVADGTSNITIAGVMNSAVLNSIKTGVGDDVIVIGQGMKTSGGSNRVETGDGNDTVFISGKISAGTYGTNIIDTGEGNDTIILNAKIGGVRDLTINAGNGWDVLQLNAANDKTFQSNYAKWFGDMAQTTVLAGSSIEEIRVDITRSGGLAGFDWLTQIINNHNARSSSHIEISVAMDNDGPLINLSDIFTTRNESSITAINLSGGNANELRIDNSLSSNQMNGQVLRVDSNDGVLDTVKMDSSTWNYLGYVDSSVYGNDKAYHSFTNSYGELIMVQEHVNWVLA